MLPIMSMTDPHCDTEATDNVIYMHMQARNWPDSGATSRRYGQHVKCDTRDICSILWS